MVMEKKMARPDDRVVLVQWAVVAMVVILALVAGTRAVPICDTDTTKLDLCRAAMTGDSPPLPTMKCCTVVHSANLPCLCSFKAMLPAFGINPAHALALPKKCGMKTPPQCQLP